MTLNGFVGAEVDQRAARPADAAAMLRMTGAVRSRSAQLLERARSGESRWFTVRDDGLHDAADLVAAVSRTRYPDLAIPYHSRWRHFEAGGVDRHAELDHLLADCDPQERARAMIDLVVLSVLLDAGAGAGWSFREDRGDATARFSRSEGLAVASWHGFVDGAFSSDPARPLRADAMALSALTEERLAQVLQATPDNPLVGLAGRVQLMRRLGGALAASPDLFGEQGRPGWLFDALVTPAGSVDAGDILAQLLTSLSPIWPADNIIGTHRLGDCWRHDAVAGPGLTAGWLPLHKLSPVADLLADRTIQLGRDHRDRSGGPDGLARVSKRRTAARYRGAEPEGSWARHRHLGPSRRAGGRVARPDGRAAR